MSPGVFPTTAVASSGFALDKLHFGDFNGDRVTDVMATVSGRWQVSWGARSSWEPINTLSDEAVWVANLDGVGSDDVIKWSASDGKWRISKEGRGPWIVFAQSFDPYAYFGRFTGFASQDLLIMPFCTRGPGQLLEKNQGVLPPSIVFKPYANYEYSFTPSFVARPAARLRTLGATGNARRARSDPGVRTWPRTVLGSADPLAGRPGRRISWARASTTRCTTCRICSPRTDGARLRRCLSIRGARMPDLSTTSTRSDWAVAGLFPAPGGAAPP